MLGEGFGAAPLSRIFGLVSIGVSILLYLQVFDTFQLYFNKRLITEKLELWRPFTSIFCYGSISFTSLIHIHNLISYSIYAESAFFGERPADFLIFSVFGWLIMWIYAFCSPVLFLGRAFSSYVLYYWAKRSPDNHLFVFGIPVPMPAPLVPFLVLWLDYEHGLATLGGDLVGFLSAHLFFFLKDCCGLKYGWRLFSAPSWANRSLMRLLN